MNIGKVYGKELTETQVKKLLSGSSVSYTKDSKKTVACHGLFYWVYFLSRYLSNHSVISFSLRTRCLGLPLRDSS